MQPKQGQQQSLHPRPAPVAAWAQSRGCFWPLAPSSLFLVVRPGATSSVLASSSDALAWPWANVHPLLARYSCSQHLSGSCFLAL